MPKSLRSTLLLIFLGLIGCGPSANQPVTAQVATATTVGKIPIDSTRWYQVCNTSSGLGRLFDGLVNQQINTGTGKLLTTYDAYYRLLPGESMNIQRVRFYDGVGSNTANPVSLSIITADWKRVLIARFTGGKTSQWVGPDPSKPNAFDFPAAVINARYLVLNTSGAYPDEIELIGTYQKPTVSSLTTVAPSPAAPFPQMVGVNGFEWNVEEAFAPNRPDESRVAALRNFAGFRHYLDWDKLENTAGLYTFNPTNNGSWNYDTLYARLKTEKIDVLVCLKTIPTWLQNTYPSGQRDNENVPARYGSNLTLPASYKEQARVGFQFMARYGYTKTVDPKLVIVSKNVTWAGTNTVKIGLGLVRYIECENERDKTWKGRKAYQTAREYAANLSAFYDGHKQTLGAGYGVKNADPTVTVVMGGLADATNTDYLRGMIDWCREFRGYRPDGRVDLCWDVINQHIYANDVGSSQTSMGAHGASPERAGLARTVAGLTTIAKQEAGGIPVWITEIGYDQTYGSPFWAIPIGPKLPAETQADWILRTALLMSRNGIDRTFFYEMYDDNVPSSTQFASMGLINPDKSRKPATDYLAQTRALLTDYRFAEALSAGPAGLLVDRYESIKSGSLPMIYALVVPDEKGRTATYALPVGVGQIAEWWRPVAGQAQMIRQVLPNQAGQVIVPVTETPGFVVVK